MVGAALWISLCCPGQGKEAGKSTKKDKDTVNKSKGKAKKKWYKGKVRDMLNNLVLFDKAKHDKL